jgi:hypothetical protein
VIGLNGGDLDDARASFTNRIPGGSSLPEGVENGNQDPQGGHATDPPTPTPASGSDLKPEGKTFTDEQLDRIIGKRAKEAERVPNRPLRPRSLNS